MQYRKYITYQSSKLFIGIFFHLLNRLFENYRQNEELKKKCSDLETLIGPFRQHLEDYERENKVLESTNEAYQEEKKALLLKFADLLGHQNPKQKIKYINKIIEENNELHKVRTSELLLFVN